MMEKLKQQPLYIWGAHYLGLGLAKSLRRRGIDVCAFIDKNPLIQKMGAGGLQVMEPQTFLSTGLASKNFVIIAATLYEDEIARALLQTGRHHNIDFCSVSDLRHFRYAVEVSGRCNLRCPSCPRGNFDPQPDWGFMSLETFEKVLDKIVYEDPLVWEVEVFRWGEPLLNPDLPEMISAAHKRGLDVLVSTNLNAGKNLKEVLAAGPRMIMVSASGFAQSYEETHLGGKWSVFENNLRLLAKLRKAEMEVEVYYHIYRGREEDLAKMQSLCASLGLTLRPSLACLLPLDHLHRLYRGEQLPAAARRIMEIQPLPASELLETVRRESLSPCGLKNLLGITPDLTVPPCSCWFDHSLKPLSTNFLETPINELVAARQNAVLCQLCEKERLHHFYLHWHKKNDDFLSV